MKFNVYITNPDDFAAGCRSRLSLFDYHPGVEEWMFAGEIDFEPSVNSEELKQGALDKIDADEKRLRAEFQRQLDILTGKRQNLLAITHEVA